MIRFAIDEHSLRGPDQVVEVWDGNKFLAAIYAGDGLADVAAVRLISRHIVEPVALSPDTVTVRFEEKRGDYLPPGEIVGHFSVPEIPGTKPLVLYFGNAEDRQELVDLVRLANPHMIARKL
jgi:hypothetical protein